MKTPQPYLDAIPTSSTIVDTKINETVERMIWLYQNGYIVDLFDKLKERLPDKIEEVENSITIKYKV